MPPPLRAAAAHGVGYRPMTDDDLPFMAELYASTREEELAPVPWPPEAKSAFLAQQFDAQHRHYRTYYPDAEWLVIERAGERIGRLYVESCEDPVRVLDIALVPGSRGQGLGGAILSDVIDMARPAARKVQVYVERQNPARRLYDRLGFEMVEEGPIYDRLERRPD